MYLRGLCIFCLVFAIAQAEVSSQAGFHRIDVQAQEQLSLSVGIDLQLGDELIMALHKGMPLFFTVDVKLQKPNWWGGKTTFFEDSQTVGIRYHVLLREWRIMQGHQEFKEFSLEDALKRITQWEGNLLTQPLAPDIPYSGKIRLRLDTSLLARPFQITALTTSGTWSFSSPWQDFNFSVNTPSLP